MDQHFDGETYSPKLDGKRLLRQFERVVAVMWDGKFHTIPEIVARISYAPYPRASEAGVSARLRDLRKPRFGGRTPERPGFEVERRRRTAGGLYEYRLIVPDRLRQQALPLGDGSNATYPPLL